MIPEKTAFQHDSAEEDIIRMKEILKESDKEIHFFGEEKILTAKEALGMTKRVHLASIFSFIEKAINEGKCECEIRPAQQFVSAENKKILTDAGYKVVEKESMLGTEILINWENA